MVEARRGGLGFLGDGEEVDGYSEEIQVRWP